MFLFLSEHVSICLFSGLPLFEIIETHKQLAQIADIMNNLLYDFFKRSVVAVERRTAKGSRVIGRGYKEETRMRDHAMKMMQYC